MRFTIAHLLPLALLLNPILAAESEANSSAVTKPVASTAARHTTAAAPSSTAKEEASATEESSGSATATGSAKNNKATSSGSDDETPTQTQGTLEVASWDPSAPATVAPDLNAGGISVRNSGFVGMGVAFGAVAMGINYL